MDGRVVVPPSAEDLEQRWHPEPLLAGATVFVLGGGPSLRGFDFSTLAGLRTIAVNQAAAHVVEQDLLYFTDTGWFEMNRPLVEGWRGEAITASRSAKRQYAGLRRILTTPGPGFPSDVIRRGRSSGHTAIGLAIALGARLVVLLGFDMRGDGGRSHFHDRYANRDLAVYGREFVPAFSGWDRDARALGVTVLNATPGSALEEFRKVDLAEVMERSIC
jgi:hypothetical protein